MLASGERRGREGERGDQRRGERRASRDHLELKHHRLVGVFERVAVEDVLAGVGREPGEHGHGLVGQHADGVLPADPVGGLDRRARALEHAELEAVDVHRVHAVGAVDEGPDLRAAQPRARVDPGRVEAEAVDLPRRRAEAELPAAARVGAGQRLERPQPRRHLELLALAAADDVEAHDRHRAAGAVLVVQDDLVAGAVGREVEHQVDALGRVQRYTRARDRPLEQAAVARDLLHRPPAAEPQRVGARVGGVEEAQPVLAPLHAPCAARRRR